MRETMPFEEAVAMLRTFGLDNGFSRFSVKDYFPRGGGVPYRHVNLDIACGEDYHGTLLAMAALAVRCGGHIYFWTHYNPVEIQLSLTRDLLSHEIPDDPPESVEVTA